VGLAKNGSGLVLYLGNGTINYLSSTAVMITTGSTGPGGKANTENIVAFHESLANYYTNPGSYHEEATVRSRQKTAQPWSIPGKKIGTFPFSTKST